MSTSDVFLKYLPHGWERNTSLTRYSTKSLPAPVMFNTITELSKHEAKICLVDLHDELGGDAIRDRLIDVLRHQVFVVAQNHRTIHPTAFEFYIYEPAVQRFARATVKWSGPFRFPKLLKGRLSGTYEFVGWDDIADAPEFVRDAASPTAFVSSVPKEWQLASGESNA